MALKDAADEARKNFEELQKLAQKLRKDLSEFNLGDTVKDAETVKELLKGWDKEFQDSIASLDSIGASFQQTVSEISKGNVGLNQTKKSFNKLTSLASDLTNHTRGYNKLSVKQLESITSQAEQEKRRLETTLNTLKAEKASLIGSKSQVKQNQESLNKIKQINSAISEAEALIKTQNLAYEDLLTNAQNLSEKQLESITSQAEQEKRRLETTLNTLKAEKASLIESKSQENQNKKNLDKLNQINAAISEAEAIVENKNEKSNAAYRDLLTNAQALAEKQGKVNDAMGLGGNALAGMVNAMDSLGMKGLSEKLGLDEAKKKMEEMADELTNGGETAATMGDKFKIMGAGLKSMGSSLGENLTDPAFLIEQMGKALKIADDGAGDLAKNMNMTYSEALGTRRELGNMATMSGDVALNTKNLQENMMAVSKAIGSNVMLNEKDLKTMTKLTSQAGFTADELMGVQKLSLVNGKSLEDNTKEILGGAKAYASRNKMVVNEKDVLREVNKASASLKLSLGGSAEAVAVAVVKAKQFGLTLEQAEKISSSLLQFESSIENELSAELLTGKELNFERARSLALEGKTAEAAAEVAKQVGTSKDFAKMNVIQQEALAKAAGMERDELAQSLMDKEAMAKMNDVEGATAKEKFDNLVKEVGMEKAKAQLGDEQLANQFEQQSVQERFTLATEKLKEVFIQIAEPVLAIVSPLMDLVGIVLPAINMLLQPIVFTFQMISSAVLAISDLITGSIPALITFGTVLTGIYLTQKGITAEKVKEFLYAGYQYAMEKKNLILKGLQKAAEVILLAYQEKGLMAAIGSAAMTAYESVARIPYVGPILGAIAAASAVALGMSLMNDGIVSPKSGGGGYGDRVMYGPEGAISFNNKDTIVAGTDLFSKGDDVISPSPNEVISPSPNELSKPQEITSPTNNITNNYTQNQNQKQEKEKLIVANSTSPKKEATPDPNSSVNSRLDSLIKATTKVNSVSTLRIQ
jgi:hypothetical protein